MRLLNIHSLELEDFVGSIIPPYFILSHRWVGKEVTFKDFVKGRCKDTPGHQKIEDFCAFVRKLANDPGFASIFGEATIEWVWIDTCCIDKRSSAELSEAINSMYQWYQGAVACFIYLNDVPEDRLDDGRRSSFIDSSWFRRGWTLQELLAPTKLVFCNASWQVLGCMNAPKSRQIQSTCKSHFELCFAPDLTELVSSISRIPYLRSKYRSRFNEVSIAERMHWAARRQTTRIEDGAYCLLGIFDINMPLLYGEGPKAFLRLQKAIMEKSTDKSIFAWTLPPGSGTSCERLFAPSPACFAMDWGHAIEAYDDGLDAILTSHGLRIRAHAIKVLPDEFNVKVRGICGASVVETQDDVFFLIFNCTSSFLSEHRLVLALARRNDVPLRDQYRFEELFSLRERKVEPEQTLFIDVW